MVRTKDSAKSSRTYVYYIKRSELLVALMCVLGIILCLYTIKIEIFKAKDSSYKALCDFNEFKVLFRSSVKAFQTRIFMSILANMGSIYLASILYFVLQDFCIVCVSMYAVNFFLLIINKNHYDFFNKQIINSKKKSS